MLMAHLLDYYNLIIKLKIGIVNPFTVTIYFQGFSGFFVFPCETCKFLPKKSAGILTGTAFCICRSIWENWLFINVECSRIHEHNMSLYSFRSSFSQKCFVIVQMLKIFCYIFIFQYFVFLMLLKIVFSTFWFLIVHC